MRLRGKVAVITGGDGGIGKAVAGAFLDEGARVVIAARSAAKLRAACAELGCRGEVVWRRSDVGRPREVRELFRGVAARFGRLDILVNAAASQQPIGPFAKVPAADAARGVAVNLLGVMLCCGEALRRMIPRRSGKIINFSGGGAFAPRANFAVYAGAKAAVVRFSETLAEEVRKSNISVNVIAPGSVDTDMVAEILAQGRRAGAGALREARRVRRTGGTGAGPAAALAVFLASAGSRGITGRVISAPWDDWRGLRARTLAGSSLYTLRRIDGRRFVERRHG